MEVNNRILILDFCNYDDYPMGGYLTFARNMMFSFGNSLALVGITTSSSDPIGKWFKKEIGGIEYDFFALAFYSKLKTKHILPDRLVSYFLIKYYQKSIRKTGIQNIFIQRQEVLQAVRNMEFKNICYCFAGLENPLAISKYKYAHYIADFFEQSFFKCLKGVSTILASGDEDAIAEMIQRSKGIVSRDQVIKFPSRINTDIFKPMNRDEIREKLGITTSDKVVLTVGRLAWLKGWKFMIDSFAIYNRAIPKSLFYFVGDGEDRSKIEMYVGEMGLSDKVVLIGKKDIYEIAEYHNASDLFIMGSFKEGWSTALIEAIACGIPSCVTNFSSAKEIIIEGVNGYVIDQHDPMLFAEGMLKASQLLQPVFNQNVKAWSSGTLKEDLLKYWQI